MHTPAPAEPVTIKNPLFTYQPLLDRAKSVGGFLLRPMSGRTSGLDHSAAKIFINAFIYSAMGDLFRRYRAWMPADREFIMSELATLLPGEKLVLMVDPAVCGDDLAARLALLKQQYGYQIAFGQWQPGDPRADWVKLADYLVVDRRGSQYAAALKDASRHGARLVVSNVESAEEFEQCLAKPVSLVIGEGVSRSLGFGEQAGNPDITRILDVIAIINDDENTSDRDVEEAFKKSPELLYQLFRLASSAQSGVRAELVSVRQIIALMGRSYILYWLKILLCTGCGGHGLTATAYIALWRGKFMELLAQQTRRVPGNKILDEAFITGALSLTHVLLELDQEALLEKLRLDSTIQDALSRHDGFLGKFLKLSEAVDLGDGDDVAALCADLNLDPAMVAHCQQQAAAWVNSLNDRIEES